MESRAEERLAPRLQYRASRITRRYRSVAAKPARPCEFVVGLTGKIENINEKEQRFVRLDDAALAAVQRERLQA